MRGIRTDGINLVGKRLISMERRTVLGRGDWSGAQWMNAAYPSAQLDPGRGVVPRL